MSDPLPNRRRGLSLMELMVVIAILGILSTIVVKNVMPMIPNAKLKAARVSVATLKEVVQLDYMNHESARKFVVTCFGADGMPGGDGADADITSKDLES